MVFDFTRGKVEKWRAQKGSKIPYLTKKDDYFKEAIGHLYSLKPEKDPPKLWQVSFRNYNFVGREAC